MHDLRAGRLAGRRDAAPGGQPGAAGAHPRQPPRLLPALGPHLGVPGAAQGPPGGRRPGAGPGVARPSSRRWSGRRPSGPEAVEDVRAMRRRIIDNVPPQGAGAGDQARPGRAARHRVRRAAAAAGARPGRRVAAGAGHHLDALRALVAGGYVGRADGEALLRGYRFLRAVEHRLQLQRLRRTHTVPTGRRRGAALAGRTRSATRADARAATPSRRSAADWVTHASEVRRLHAKLLYRPLLEAVARVPADGLRLTPEAARHRLEILGFADPAGALRHLQALTGGVTRTAAIQRTLLPVLLERVRRRAGARPGPARLPAGLRHARQHPVVPAAAARRGPGGAAGWPGCSACPATSPTCWSATRRRCGCSPTTAELAPRARRVACGRLRRRGGPARRPGSATRAVRALRRRELVRLRLRRRAQLVRHRLRRPAPRRDPALAPSGRSARDVAAVGAGARPTSPTPPSAPRCGPPGRPRPALPGLRFAVIGMGRLGGYESSYLSDADVLFVYEPPAGATEDAASAAAHADRRGAAPAARRARPRAAARRRRRPAPGGPAGPAGAQPRRVRAVLRRAGRRSGRRRRCCGPGSSAATPTSAPSSWRWPTGSATRPTG